MLLVVASVVGVLRNVPFVLLILAVVVCNRSLNISVVIPSNAGLYLIYRSYRSYIM